MDAPAQTFNYFIAGYTVIFGGLLLYLVSLFVRFRNLRRDEAMLEEVEKKGE